MARNKLLTACALAVLTTALYGCSSSDSGPTQAELDAAQAAAAAAAAEAERVKAEAEAAAEAAAAAAAQAEADKQAAVEAARQAAILEQQQMAVMAAIAAADAAVDALMNDSSDADVAGAMADIAGATAAIAAATAFSADQTAMYGAQVTAIQANLTLAEANIRAYRAEMARDDAQMQATAAERAKMAVDDAIMALDAAQIAENLSEAGLATARTALASAQQAVADAADNDALMAASEALAAALMQVSTASADYSVKAMAVADATTALSMARDDLAEADPDHVALQEANAKLAQAMTDAQAQADRIKELEDQIAALRKAEEERMQDEADAAEEERMMEMAAAGKALKAALGAMPLANLDDGSDGTTGSAMLTATGLSVQSHADANATPAVPAVTLAAVKGSEGSLGGWNSMKYMQMSAGTKVTNEAMVYTNQADPEMEPAATGFAAETGYNATARTLTLPTAASEDYDADMLPTAGTTTFTGAPGTNVVSFPGTYKGASGTFSCIGTDCSAAVGANGITLGGGTSGWTFHWASNAMVSTPDTAYLYFGWWLRKDDGVPDLASAFHGEFGNVEATGTLATVTGITGSATYTGQAAGKFAISHPINGGDAGHFTADATLTAKFGAIAAPTNGGISGTLDNFMANDKSVPWTVSLHRAAWDGTTNGAFASTADTTNSIAEGTTWSIDGHAATESGSWMGQVYDEALLPATASDGSDVPTSVSGVFQSHFGSDHTMVGGFGATK